MWKPSKCGCLVFAKEISYLWPRRCSAPPLMGAGVFLPLQPLQPVEGGASAASPLPPSGTCWGCSPDLRETGRAQACGSSISRSLHPQRLPGLLSVLSMACPLRRPQDPCFTEEDRGTEKFRNLSEVTQHVEEPGLGSVQSDAKPTILLSLSLLNLPRELWRG